MSNLCHSSVIQKADDNTPLINGLATGSFFVLSALLGETTKNPSYQEAAYLSAGFFQNHLLTTDHLINDNLGSSAEGACPESSGPLDPYNSALAIEGFSILNSTAYDSEREQFLLQTVSSATSNITAPWVNADGVIVSTSGVASAGHPQRGGDAHMIRALNAVYHRTKDDTLRNYVKSYLATQYNAVLDQATTPNTNIYGFWTGPPSSKISGDNQTVALNILVDAISLNETTTSGSPASPTPTDSPEPESPKSSSNKIGAIIGGVIGGIVFTSLAILVGVWFRRKHLRKNGLLEMGQSGHVLPFLQRRYHSAEGEKGNRETQSQSASNATTNIQQKNRKAPIMNPVMPTSTDSQQLPSKNSRYNENMPQENSGSGLGSRGISNSDSQLQTGTTQEVVGPRANGNLPVQARDRQDLSTDELVRLLNQRLQPGPHWNTEELPPEYLLAQSFSETPSTLWRKPTITTPRQQQIDIASGALQAAQDFLNQSTALYPDNNELSMPGTLFYGMARFDELTGQSIYKEPLRKYFGITQAQHPADDAQLLSALLGETTKNQSYQEAAYLAAGFFKNHLLTSNHLINDQLHSSAEGACPESSGPLGPYNSALAIEGFSILNSTAYDSEREQFLLQTVSSATSNTTAPWVNDDGVIVSALGSAFSQGGGDDHMIRALNAVYHRTKDNTLRDYVKSYLATQYNAVLDQATTPNTNIYGFWTGPPSSKISGDNQTVALNILVDAISLNETTTSGSPASPTPTESPEPEPQKSSSNNGAIIGGVIGGIVFTSLAVLVGVCFRRKHLQKNGLLEMGQSGRVLPFLQRRHHSTEGEKGNRETRSPSNATKNIQQKNRKAPMMNPVMPTSTDSLQLSSKNNRYNENMPQENSGSGLGSRGISNSDSQLQTGTTQEVVGPRVNGSLPAQARDRQDLSTDELVRLLNQRLQPGPHWNAEELPPEYRMGQ
ncbi:hypothetical protein VKT23_005965 [Stygiomarasmius scandens]|uniref:Uncharacterized protein n=1 Tax=Marasmiellus scandens TaxID=2682957 RepID=A0ABR1JNY8_9AGAR